MACTFVTLYCKLGICLPKLRCALHSTTTRAHAVLWGGRNYDEYMSAGPPKKEGMDKHAFLNPERLNRETAKGQGPRARLGRRRPRNSRHAAGGAAKPTESPQKTRAGHQGDRNAPTQKRWRRPQGAARPSPQGGPTPKTSRSSQPTWATKQNSKDARLC